VCTGTLVHYEQTVRLSRKGKRLLPLSAHWNVQVWQSFLVHYEHTVRFGPAILERAVERVGAAARPEAAAVGARRREGTQRIVYRHTHL